MALILVLTALSGCGQKGPLYMPRAGATSPTVQPSEPVAPTAPATSTQTTPAADPTNTEKADSKQGDQHAA